ncbi:MAG: DNA replication and repair protein RecF [Candidatus Dormibacteraeota bacterium]|nr:DNA replication and repair protein RecF [Candidatus Dormibacteraeota bacterium]
MHVTQLRLLNFRIYQQAALDLLPGVNLIVGENGSGKTSLLEAVATVALTRSPRTGTVAECASFQAVDMGISLSTRSADSASVLEFRAQRQPDSGRWLRTIKENGSQVVPRHILGRLGVVIFWPEDLAMVKGGPEPRRRMLDVALSQLYPAYAEAAVKCRRAVEQRNTVLRRVRDGLDSWDALEPWDRALAMHGGAVMSLRRQYLQDALPAVREAVAGIGETGEVEIIYRPGVRDLTGDDLKHGIVDSISRVRPEEIARGQSIVGPQRDDFDISLGGQPARQFASQGQQRTLVLALKVAEVRSHLRILGRSPLVMLDDVLSELDLRHREGLVAQLARDLKVEQTLITTTEPGGVSEQLGLAKTLVVNSGKISEVSPEGGFAWRG